LAFACLFALALPAFGQQADDAITRGIPGYLDPHTGVFKLAPSMNVLDADAIAAASTTVGGKIVTAFTINVQSAIPATAKIGCSVQATVLDVATANTIFETATVVATRSGTTATCTVTIPYSWTLGSAATDKVILNYLITAPVLASATTALPSRTSSQGMGQIAVPANGVTTNKTVSATI
jgi:hypothetical protein